MERLPRPCLPLVLGLCFGLGLEVDLVSGGVPVAVVLAIGATLLTTGLAVTLGAGVGRFGGAEN